MTETQIIAFVVAPLALAALGWAVALATDWLAHHPRDV